MKDKPYSMISVERFDYCPIHSHEIDNELVNELKPMCIKAHKGCDNCPCVVYITEMKVKMKDGKEFSRTSRKVR